MPAGTITPRETPMPVTPTTNTDAPRRAQGVRADLKESLIAADLTIEGKIEGSPLGVAGRLTAIARTQLSEVGPETHIKYTIDATLTGKLGSIGQPVLKAKAREMEKQFTERLRAAFAEGVPEAAR